MLALLKRYGEAAREARAPGFVGIATHRGYRPEHVASYEQWSDVDAYRRATSGPLAPFLCQLRAMVTESELYPYRVLSVTRFD